MENIITHLITPSLEGANNALSIDLGNDTIVCADPVLLDATSPGATYSWSTGETTSSISVSATGTYSVEVEVNGCSVSDTIEIIVNTALTVDLGNDTTVCADSHELNATTPFGSYIWNTDEFSPSITVDATGEYWVEVTAGCVASDTILVTFASPPLVDLPDEVVLCPGGEVILDAGNPGASFLWSSGAVTQSIVAALTGTYSVTVANNLCSATDSTEVILFTKPDLGPDIEICSQAQVILDPENVLPGSTFTWSTGETTALIVVSDTGFYSVEITNGICTAEDTIRISGIFNAGALYVPNAFTPNGDSKNEVFIPVTEYAGQYHFIIFNRWGEVVFESEIPMQGWDGTYRSATAETGVYTWMIEYSSQCSYDYILRETGTVVLLR